MTEFYILHFADNPPIVLHSESEVERKLGIVRKHSDTSTMTRKFPPNGIELKIEAEFANDPGSGELGFYIRFTAEQTNISYIATHEAGHFLAAYLLWENDNSMFPLSPPKWVTCLPYMKLDLFRSSLLLGCAYSSDCCFSFSSPAEEHQMLQHTVQTWGGEVAEELIYGHVQGDGAHLLGDRKDRDHILTCFKRDQAVQDGDVFVKEARIHAERLLSGNIDLLRAVIDRLCNQYVLTTKDISEIRQRFPD